MNEVNVHRGLREVSGVFYLRLTLCCESNPKDLNRSEERV